MPRRSQLDEHADWLIMRANQDTRTIAKAYEETFGKKISHAAIANWFKKNVKPKLDETLQKVQETYAIDLKKANDLLDELIRDSMAMEKMGLLERNAFRSKLEAVREKLKILGAYPTTQNVTQVAVQVNVKEAKEKLWAILSDEG